MPATIPAPPPGAEGASSVDLLNDSQIRFGDEGYSAYYDIAYKIASAEGLDDAPLQVSWDPSLESLTLHRYRIIRDGKSIDLLADGAKLSIIQREKNLESAALDGELTASLQPDDVRVGDIIEIAFTRTRRDPALAGHSEALTGPNDGTPYGRLRVRLIWPDSKKLQWRALPGALQPKAVHSALGNELLVDLSDVTTAVAPNGAPGRFSVVNAIDVSDFRDWAAVSAAILPRYAEATVLSENSPVKAEARRIAATTSDPKRRAEMALQLVQEQIRYLFVGMNDGGYVPAPADLTWTRRFGDCKGKAALLVALLRELGIDAVPALVNTGNGDLVAHRLPAMQAFDHVIVRARIGGQTYWLDGTRLGDTHLERLGTPPYEVALPIAADTKSLVPLTPEPLLEPSETLSLALDASGGIDTPAQAVGEMRFRGSSAADMRMKYSGLSAADLDKGLRDLWRKNYDQVSPTSLSAATDENTGDFVIKMTGTAKMNWFSDSGARWYEVDRSRLGWKFDTARDGAIIKDAPYAIDYPDYWESRETIKLPVGGEGFRLQGGAIDRTIGGIYAFHREVAVKDGVLTMESSTRALAPELPAGKAEETRSEMADLENDGVYVRVPDNYMATAADIAGLQNNKAALITALLHRGAVHFDRKEFPDSIADEQAVIASTPDNATAHSLLALDFAAENDPKADDEADRAIALDPKQVLAWRAKGAVAMAQKRFGDADLDFSRDLGINAKDAEALVARASARLALGRFADALSDADAALALVPDVNLHMVRAAALGGLGRKDESLAEADRAVEIAPDSEMLRKIRADLRSNFGEPDLAKEDYDVLIKRWPKAEYYLLRASVLPASDKSAREADIAAALRIDPHSVKALALRTSMAIEAGDFASADKDIAAIQQIDHDSPILYQMRVQLLEKEDRGRDAIALMDAQLAKHPSDASALNERCWTKATLNLQIDTALADCDASLKLAPNSAATLDSKGFAELRLGQIDGAIRDYDAALKLAPALPASLYGRAIARARKGDEVGALADLAQARKLSANIDARFAAFGMELPPSLPARAQTDHAGTGTPK